MAPRVYNRAAVYKACTRNHKKIWGKLEAYNLDKFNSNIIDPIKLVFDKTVYALTWDEIVKNEVSRQRDKSNNNDIGYFHQRFFSYLAGCVVPDSGWDIIYTNDRGIELPDGDQVSRIYIEMKNKHNTMNSASSSKTYMKMQNQLLNDDDCACFLVEAIAKKSQNIKWEASVDSKKMQHKRIRRVSMDKFYALVTGIDDVFYQTCLVLPSVIENAVKNSSKIRAPQDSVMAELNEMAGKMPFNQNDMAIAMAIYPLGFNRYQGFEKHGENRSQAV